MQYILAAALVAFTIPLWGGALAAVIGGSFYLLFHNPLIFLGVAVIGAKLIGLF